MVLQALATALAAGNAQAAGQAYAAALQKGGSAAAAATTVLATAIATADCNGVIVTAIASKAPSTPTAPEWVTNIVQLQYYLDCCCITCTL